MSIKDLLAAYAVTLALFVVGCWLIEYSKVGLKGARWLKAAFSIACAGASLALLNSLAPPFFSEVLPHLAIFSALVLMHQAINDVLELNRRYLPFSFVVGSGALIGLVSFTIIYPNGAMRLYIIDVADTLQAALTAVTLFRSKNSPLRFPILNVAYVMAGIASVHLLRIVRNVTHPVPTSLSQVGPFQVFITFLNFIFGLAAGFSLIWLSIYGHRNTLEVLAHTDGLTGLMNRRAFEEVLQRELISAQSQGKSIALILVDLDFFKNINDEFGHLVGDEIIRVAAGILQDTARSSDVVGRFGGDEFVLMLRDADPTGASTIAELICRRMESAGERLPGTHITASVGVSVSGSGDTPESFLRKTDEALYRSKGSGRNTFTCNPPRPRLPRLGHGPRTLWRRAQNRTSR